VIRNERQYRVTQAERDRLASSITTEEAADGTPQWAIDAANAEINAQIMEMDEELAEYEALRAGVVALTTNVSDLAGLPRALIRARIASHMTQKELASRLGMREQQIQRYEATDYAGASISRLQEVAQALGVTFEGELSLPDDANTSTKVQHTLRTLGLTKSVISRRFFGDDTTEAGWRNALTRAARVFATNYDELLEGSVTQLANAGAFRARITANAEQLNAYAWYAEYLAGCLARACTVDYRPLPDASTLRKELGRVLTDEPLETLVRTCWEHGVPVLPLADAGTFFGACWHLGDRPVIALKHTMRSRDRWAFLLGHEMDHCRNPDAQTVLEQDLDVREWREQPAERAADDYATQLLLGDAAEAMVHVAVEQANGDVAQLKKVVPAVALAGEVSPGLLADHVAFRLSQQDINWWPTANRLHPTDVDAWRTTRSVLFDYVDLTRLDQVDRDLLVDGISQ
jgi:DNA-binding XRE family transcriptional regulator